MSRELKFRAWDKYAKKMIAPHDGDFIKWHAMSNWKDCLEVMQYTGLKDKNGKEIYEGDICKSDHGTVGKIEFHNGAFCWCNGGNYWCIHETPNDGMPFDETILQVEDVLIVGNIYENPELLEATENE